MMPCIIALQFLLLAMRCCVGIGSDAIFTIPLTNRRHIVSSGRWGGNDSYVVERRLEAIQMKKEEESRRRRLSHSSDRATSMPDHEAPLFQGIGTHYANVYVGTPPQRVSVIVDTGSHHTAFPCKGCSNCGTHTDPYFDPTRSSTSHHLQCSKCAAGARCVNKKCQFSQSYTEGSSWKAYQITDQFWLGGVTADSQPAKDAGQALSVEMLFGCQYSETGLFRTQKADGIMGLSANPLTIVPTLRKADLVESKSFSLCFMKGGGIFSVGGSEPQIHKEPMVFIPTTKPSGWFTVHLESISLGDDKLDVSASAYNGGKGAIVDSGTTDTYLTRKAATSFKRIWKSHTGTDYGNVKMTISDDKYRRLPVIIFTFKDVNGVKVNVHMPPDSYMEKVGPKYVPRVYLSESQGVVLGANFMQDHDVLFDEDGQRVGIARSDCSYSRHLTSQSEYVNASNRSRLSVNSTYHGIDDAMETEYLQSLSPMGHTSKTGMSILYTSILLFFVIFFIRASKNPRYPLPETRQV